MSVLAHAGCVAFSQANVPITDTQVLWRAMQYAATFAFPVWLRAEDKWLSREGVAHDGEVRRAWDRGHPRSRRPSRSPRCCSLSAATGARLHVCRFPRRRR
jgi:dihydroorotase